MGRNKKYMDDGDDSSDEEGGAIKFDYTEEDLEDEMAGFAGQPRRRFKGNYSSDEDEEEDTRGGLGSRGGLGLGPSFLPAKQQTPLKETPEASPIRKDPVKEKVSRNRTPQGTPPPGPGFGEFNKFSKGIGQKLLEKYGWSKGKGLGADGAGIVNPVETKLRPARMGLSFRGFDEKTDQAKQEDKARRGEVSEDDEEEKPQRKRNAWKEKKQPTATATSTKPRKQKTVYKTAADIVAETEEHQVPLSQQKVIDMTGPSIREISLSDIKRTDSPTLMEITNRLPELRHNLRLIVDLARGDLENLSKEKQSTAFKMKSLSGELDAIKANLDKDQETLRKLEQLKELAQQMDRISKNALSTGAYETGNMTALFGEQFAILERDFEQDIKTMQIDALVVSVWVPILKYKSMTWNVLEEPTWGLNDVKKWKKLLVCNEDKVKSRQQATDLVCTPFEQMMNTIWLSKVRSAIK
jgi:tuftelin-interacting protein 11